MDEKSPSIAATMTSRSEHQTADRLAGQRGVAGAEPGRLYLRGVRRACPVRRLWGAIHGWGVREAWARAGWSLLVAGVTVFTVRLALWLG